MGQHYASIVVHTVRSGGRGTGKVNQVKDGGCLVVTKVHKVIKILAFWQIVTSYRAPFK